TPEEAIDYLKAIQMIISAMPRLNQDLFFVLLQKLSKLAPADITKLSASILELEKAKNEAFMLKDIFYRISPQDLKTLLPSLTEILGKERSFFTSLVEKIAPLKEPDLSKYTPVFSVFAKLDRRELSSLSASIASLSEQEFKNFLDKALKEGITERKGEDLFNTIKKLLPVPGK
ncbi:MAG: hypothetical protein NZ841_08575, partial [Dictyoglomus sp.]|nr:hypothetical protein [Dictyoglomus sp.]MDW8189336.1 hypothetical protein [Dictyoglomus sp.]